MHHVGALAGALDIWQMAIAQSLLNNSEMWVEMSDEATKSLESLQKLFCQVILEVSGNGPSPCYNWETGLLDVKFQVMERKLNFLNSLKKLDAPWRH